MGFYIGGVTSAIVGIILFFVYRHNLAKCKSIELATPAKAGELVRLLEGVSEVAGRGQWGDYVKISGTVQCQHPLQSPIKQEPCVYYSSSVVREYEEIETRTYSDGHTTTNVTRNSETISNQVHKVPFEVRDETGAIAIDPDGAEIQPLEILNRFEPENSNSRRRAYGYRQSSYGEGGYGSQQLP